MKSHNSGFVTLANDAKSRIQETDSEAVNAMLKKGEKFTLIDVREECEWTTGHLPNAVHLSKGIIERDIEKLIPDYHQKVVLYCGGGFRSALAADNLQKMGYTQVLSMDGGFGAWRENGFPIVREC